MKHKITQKEIEEQSFAMVVAAETYHNDRKELQLVLCDGIVSWTVRFFKNAKPESSTNHDALNTAIRYYNEI